ncbi:MAG: hypothetical protein P9F19_06370 [Candidatus Contendobacter sp.]|nr:hypothetical protein [Candidatus Contendobacter sp.]MDG4556995.1 hypothetical protein [Candidatus Contendobacter sp.]
MAYSDFSLTDAKEKLDLALMEKVSLFSQTVAMDYSDHLKETLKYNVPLATSINTEKARSELIVTPVLVEVIKILNQEVSLFSRIEFNVDKNRGLNGVCDYIISLSAEQLFLDAPIITIVEAKNDNLKIGLGQCISEMLAEKIFNENKGLNIESTFGAVTTGSLWSFLKLTRKTVWIDMDEYHISNVAKILGIFISIIKSNQSASTV